MKKLLLVFIVLFSLLSCTENQRARNFGGTETVDLPKNRILLTATWKQDDLWILSKDTLTNQVFFNEKSNWGVLNGTIEFKNN
jgi:hypothetical protein